MSATTVKFTECKPKEECEPLKLPRALKPGEKVVKQELGCCPTQEIVCDVSTCPPALKECAERFYEVVREQELDECCPHYLCGESLSEEIFDFSYLLIYHSQNLPRICV